MSFFDWFSRINGDQELALLELKEIRERLDKKGYTYLWQIPDSDPDKARWIQLMRKVGVPVDDPVNKIKSVDGHVIEETKLLEDNHED